MHASTRPPGIVRATARAINARASSRWRGGNTSTSGNKVVSSGSRRVKPDRCSASASGLKLCSQTSPGNARWCSGQPSRARRNSAPPVCGHASAPLANGSHRVSSAASPVSTIGIDYAGHRVILAATPVNASRELVDGAGWSPSPGRDLQSKRIRTGNFGAEQKRSACKSVLAPVHAFAQLIERPRHPHARRHRQQPVHRIRRP